MSRKRRPNNRRSEEKPTGSAAAPPNGTQDLPDIMEKLHMQARFLITCGAVRVPRLSEEDRRETLAKVNLYETVLALAELRRAFDIEHGTTQNFARVEHVFLAYARKSWVDRVRGLVDEGHRLVSPQATAQLLREVIAFGSTDSAAPKIDRSTLVHMYMSVTSERQARPEFDGDVPPTSWVREHAAKVQELDLDQTTTMSGTIIPDIVAARLFNAPVNLDMILANTLDTWFRPWSKKTNGLGASAADTFKMATGVDLLDVIHLGTVVAKLALTRQQVQFHGGELIALGVSEPAINLLFDSMPLPLNTFREELTRDRLAGPVSHQRYKLTRYPFLMIDDDQFIMLSHAWAIDKLCGSQLHFIAGTSLAVTHSRSLAGLFRSAMADVFEDVVGEILGRIVRRSRRIRKVITEEEMQAAWCVKKGEKPSACDWAAFADGHCIVIDATTHSVKSDIAQGLSTWDAYSEDIEKIFTETKFDQLRKTCDQLLARGGWDDQVVDEDTDFIPLVVVPDAGLPDSELIEVDVMRRGHPVFQHLQPHVYPPTIMQLANLQLLEGIAEFYGGTIDIFEIIRRWRRSPGQPLQIFLSNNGLGLAMSQHIRASSRTLKETVAKRSSSAA